MRHDVTVSGHAFAIRPVQPADAGLIVRLRSDQERTRHLHPIALEESAQREYIARYLDRDDDYYFVIERIGAGGEGLIGLYDVDLRARRAEWGRWILSPRSLGAVESAWLIYRVGFELLGLDEIYCRTLAENESVLSFHDRCGLVRRRRIEGGATLDGEQHDLIEHVLTTAGWPETSRQLEDRATRVAARMRSPR
jgi:RimJ/RimL family protein N-acetyltransferase